MQRTRAELRPTPREEEGQEKQTGQRTKKRRRKKRTEIKYGTGHSKTTDLVRREPAPVQLAFAQCRR
eukprot:2978902-Rhodomonas_salina.2